jgi:nitrate reductase gamma subunit
MSGIDVFAFLVFPYISLTVFAVGHGYRYLTDLSAWNAKSSELFEKRSLFYGITIFHWGILATLGGHAAGMLVPQWVYDLVGVNARLHETMAHLGGIVVGGAAVAGSALLLWRRIANRRAKVHTSVNDFVTLGGLLFVSGIGTYNVLFGHADILYSIAPWIRSILLFQPDVTLMASAPLGFKIHIFSALALLGFSPFSRLVHIWSVPFTYLTRRLVVFRRQAPVGG